MILLFRIIIQQKVDIFGLIFLQGMIIILKLVLKVRAQLMKLKIYFIQQLIVRKVFQFLLFQFII
nr:MAG TPA: hypothetical protein [Caudoviricetes sp.]